MGINQISNSCTDCFALRGEFARHYQLIYKFQLLFRQSQGDSLHSNHLNFCSVRRRADFCLLQGLQKAVQRQTHVCFSSDRQSPYCNIKLLLSLFYKKNRINLLN